jgi:energy-converting hydrogenase Eha subunit E
LDEQDFGSSFEFSSRRFDAASKCGAAGLTSVGICLILLSYDDFVA